MKPGLLIFFFLTFMGCDGRAVTRFLEAAGTARLSVSVSGLKGSGLTLSAAGEALAVTENGAISFSGRFRRGQSYTLTVNGFPGSPNQHCMVTPATVTMEGSETFVSLTCGPGSAAGPMVGGNIIHALGIQGNADTVLGEFFAGAPGISAATDGIGSAARLLSPAHMVTDGVDIYLLESNPVGTVRKITIATRQVTTLGDSGGSDGITSDGAYLYLSSFNNCTVRKMSLTDFSVVVLAGADNVCNFADNPVGASARFNNPIGITFDGTSLYVADYSNARIRRVDPVTGATTTFAGTGIASSTNGPAATATFDFPHGLIYYGNRLYLTESTPTNQRIRTIDLSAAPYNVTTLAGTGVWACTDGAAGVAQFKKLRHLAVDGSYLYATDKECYNVRRIDLATGMTSTVAGWESRTATAIGTSGAGGTAGFREPTGIVADGSYLYVTDPLDFVLRRLE